MAKKSPVVMADILGAQTPLSPTSAEPAEADSAEPAPPPAAAGQGRAFKRIGLYLHPAVAREIATIAFTHDRKAHDVYLEGLDLLLKAYGRPSIAQLSKK